MSDPKADLPIDVEESPDPSAVAEARAAEAAELLAAYEREARALGTSPEAALLFHEIGRLWEEQRSPRNAAIAYQNAWKLDPKLLPNVRAARRLFSEVGNHAMVVQLIDAEGEVVDGADARAELLFEKGLVLEEKLGRVDDALTCYEKALELSPRSLAVLDHLTAFHADAKTPIELAELHRRTAAALDDPALAARHLATAAGLLEDRAGKIEDAARLWREAFARDRREPIVCAAVARHAEREADWTELVAVLAAHAELEGANAAPIYVRMAKVYRDRLGREEDGISALLAARRAAPGDALVLGELARLHEIHGRWEELAEVLRARISSLSDEAEIVSLNLRLGALFEEKLDRKDEAVARYRAVLALQPANAAALASLGKLCHQRGDWEGLLQTYEAEVAAADEPKSRAAKIYKAAEILEERLGRTEEAISRYNQILQLQPGYLPAQKALTRLYERQGRFAELVAMLEQDLATMQDRDQIIATLQRIAELCDEELEDGPRAIAVCRRILEVAPDHLPTVRALGRLAEKSRQWEEVVRANELEASLAGDQRQVVSLLHRNAELLEEAIGDQDRAIEAYRKVVQLAPGYLPALKSLGKLYAQKGRYAELIEMYRQEAEVAASADHAATLVFKIGELYERRLSQEDRAIAAYREVLTNAPTHLPALRALARIYRERRAWDQLVEVLREEAAARVDPGERGHVLFQIAELFEEQLGRADQAIDAHHEVLRLQPGHAASLRALDRLYSRAGAVRDLVQVHERELAGATGAPRASAFLKLARLWIDRLGDPARAAQCCEGALQADPGNLLALTMLDRIRTGQGDRGRRADVRGRLASRTTDRRAAAALWLAAAADRERATSGQLPLEELRRAYAADPTDPRAIEACERALRKAGDHGGVVQLLAARIEASSDVGERAALLFQLGELCEWWLGDRGRAVSAYREVLSTRPGHLPALRALRRVLSAMQDHDGVHGVLVAEADAARDVAHAVETYLSAGELAEKVLSDPERAAACYRAALARDPLEPRAARRLEELLAARGGAEEIARLYEQRALSGRTPADAAEDLLASARVRMEKLGQKEPALALLDQALARAPQLAEALERRGQLCFELGRSADAAQAWQARVQLGGDPTALAVLHHRLGQLHADALGDPGRAVAHLQTALTSVPTMLPALSLLARLHLSARNWAGASDALRRLVELEGEAAPLAAHHVELGRVLEEGFGDHASAAAQYERALQLQPAEPLPSERLFALYERLGDEQKLVLALERRGEVLAPSDPLRAAALFSRAGRVLAAKAGEHSRAIATLRHALQLDPTNTRSRALLADLFSQDPSATSHAVDEHRTLLKQEPLRIESWRALFRLWERAGQNDRAFVAGSVLQALRAAEAAELAWLSSAQQGRPADPVGALGLDELDRLLCHPLERGPLDPLLEAIGDQLGKLWPPQLDRFQVGRSDKLKAEHPLRRMFDRLTGALGLPADAFELYLSKHERLALFLDTPEPQAVIVGQDVATRYHRREQSFLLGRLAYRTRRRAAILSRLRPAELADLFGAAAKSVDPAFNRLGKPSDDLVKRVGKALSRKARKQLEDSLRGLAVGVPLDAATFSDGLRLSADRAGLLLSGDPGAALGLLARDDPQFAQAKLDTPEAMHAALHGRREAAELLLFAASDDHFRLRVKLELALK